MDPDETAISQVIALGFEPDDVRHIALTHLHRDHTGGLPDFPRADVHVTPAEFRAVTDPAAEHHEASLSRFMAAHRAHRPRLIPTEHGENETWYGFDAVSTMRGVGADIRFIETSGHTPGHAAVAVRQDSQRQGSRWLLHAGDAYMFHGEKEAEPKSHPMLDPIQDGAQTSRTDRLRAMDQLRKLHREHAGEVEIFCAHDPWEFRLQRSVGTTESHRSRDDPGTLTGPQ